jgi:hypothetical protein
MSDAKFIAHHHSRTSRGHRSPNFPSHNNISLKGLISTQARHVTVLSRMIHLSRASQARLRNPNLAWQKSYSSAFPASSIFVPKYNYILQQKNRCASIIGSSADTFSIRFCPFIECELSDSADLLGISGHVHRIDIGELNAHLCLAEWQPYHRNGQTRIRIEPKLKRDIHARHHITIIRARIFTRRKHKLRQTRIVLLHIRPRRFAQYTIPHTRDVRKCVTSRLASALVPYILLYQPSMLAPHALPRSPR